MVAAIGLPFDVLSYEEHSRGQGSAREGGVLYRDHDALAADAVRGRHAHQHHHGLVARHAVGGEPGDRLGRPAVRERTDANRDLGARARSPGPARS